ncbi:recombinase family protein [Streptomyces virginiae]|uniref:recombinase family protein n=1 Tax=Streptomyces virginiae TaxID=1961 RepID=UPI0022578E59|nr:recombinase family protein [Streptomyces virginiae]MCX5174228.1 recombinase family protein [Streptomyces virginiae]
MDRDNAAYAWNSWLAGGEGLRVAADPHRRLMYLRQNMLHEATHALRRNGRTPRVALYVCTRSSDPEEQFALLRAVAVRRAMRVGAEFTDGHRPIAVEQRTGLLNALAQVRQGYVDGILCPDFEHISPHLDEYERVLRTTAQRRWFVALRDPETTVGL